jgi:hypothetical protein
MRLYNVPNDRVLTPHTGGVENKQWVAETHRYLPLKCRLPRSHHTHTALPPQSLDRQPTAPACAQLLLALSLLLPPLLRLLSTQRVRPLPRQRIVGCVRPWVESRPHTHHTGVPPILHDEAAGQVSRANPDWPEAP